MAMNHNLRAVVAQFQRRTIAARGGYTHQQQKRFSSLPRFSVLPQKQQFSILPSPNRCMTHHLSQRRLFSAGSGIQNFVANIPKVPNEIIKYILKDLLQTIWVYVNGAPGGFLNCLKRFLNYLKVRWASIWAEMESITDKSTAKILLVSPFVGIAKNVFYLDSLYQDVQVIRQDVQVIQILSKIGPFAEKPDIDPFFVIAQLKQSEILQKVEEENLQTDEEEIIKKKGGSWLPWKTSPRED